MQSHRFLIVAVLICLTTPAHVDAQGRTDQIAVTGQMTPEGDATFLGFSTPQLNDSGQVSFGASLAQDNITQGAGIFRSGGGVTTTVMRSGQPVPDGNGVLDTLIDLGRRVINKHGQVSWYNRLTQTAGGSVDNEGVFRGAGGTITQIARKGQPSPGGNGTIGPFSGFVRVANDLGQAVFDAQLNGTSGGSSDDEILLRGDGNQLTPIARKGDASPDGIGTFQFFGDRDINRFGLVAFDATVAGTVPGDNGIFVGSGGIHTTIVRRGDPAPDGNGLISSTNSHLLNAAGQVAFFGSLSGTSGGELDNRAIYRGDGNSLTQIVRRGQTAPDGNGIISGGLSFPTINKFGLVAFNLEFSGTTGGATDNQGLYVGNGGNLKTLVRKGQMAPGGDGHFANFPTIRYALNDAGAVAFRADLGGTSDGSNNDQGIFLADGQNLIQVVRKGDLINGAAVTNLTLGSIQALNKFGQVTYEALLSDDSRVINRWTPPLYWHSNDTVLVGNADNAPDSTGSGSVPYEFRAGRTEVTNFEYAQFLNAKAASDPLGLYHVNMASDGFRGGILREGDDGDYTYLVKPDMGDKPVNWVSWYDSVRFTNWLHNGQGEGDTDSGAYTLLGGTPIPQNVVERNTDAEWFLLNDDEWYKAAYHHPAADGGDADNYWLYPMRTNAMPGIATADDIGDISNPGMTVSNHSAGADWNNLNGHLTTVGTAGLLNESYYGTSDQGGNVWEWTETLGTGGFRAVRGGGFNGNPLDQAANSPSLGIVTAESMTRGFRIGYRPRLVIGDFNNDQVLDCVDIDALTTEVAGGGMNLVFDLNGDSTVDMADVAIWLDVAGNLNVGGAYIPGDANLDGAVDVSDFNIWNSAKFTSNSNWCSGNFNGDTVVDLSDFGTWNSRKFTASSGGVAIPEPMSEIWFWLFSMALLFVTRFRQHEKLCLV